MLDGDFESLLSGIQGVHQHQDPQLIRELVRRYDAFSAQLAQLPLGLRYVAETLTWDLLPADWPLWLEIGRAAEDGNTTMH